jgi:hypothetical protein
MGKQSLQVQRVSIGMALSDVGFLPGANIYQYTPILHQGKVSRFWELWEVFF